MNKTCKECKKIIIEDFTKWLRENKDDKYLECPYCGSLEELK